MRGARAPSCGARLKVHITLRCSLTWSNHVRTLLCHFLWKWAFGTTLLCFTILPRRRYSQTQGTETALQPHVGARFSPPRYPTFFSPICGTGATSSLDIDTAPLVAIFGHKEQGKTMSKINSELLDQQLKAEAPVAEASCPVSTKQQ